MEEKKRDRKRMDGIGYEENVREKGKKGEWEEMKMMEGMEVRGKVKKEGV